MTVLLVIIAPDLILKKKAKAIKAVDNDVRKLMDDMLETMYHAEGIGLAATQIGDLRSVLVMDVAQREDDTASRDPIVMANPVITWTGEELNTYQEGCLSIPDLYGDVERPAEVKVTYLDRNGDEQKVHADGILATCLQHEIDHLNGILFTDHLSALKRNMIMKKSAKTKKLRAEFGDED
jgi:peptide deformylase